MKKHILTQLDEDEIFFIYSNFQNRDISILFSTPVLIKNLIRQSQQQSSFSHLDGTFKFINLGLPVLAFTT